METVYPGPFECQRAWICGKRKQWQREARWNPPSSREADVASNLRSQYGFSLLDIAGTPNALYERHLMFDNVVDVAMAGARERYEALARSTRDTLSQRWIKTEGTYAKENPKRVYYLSIEYLIGRSLANNVRNLLLDPIIGKAIEMKES